MIVITDGKQTTTKAYTELSVASQGVKNKGVAVYAVGVGKGADAAELREIASSRENVYISESFKELQALAVEIRKKLCDSKFLTLLNAMNSVSVCFKVTVERHFIRLAGSSCLPFLAKRVEFAGHKESYFRDFADLTGMLFLSLSTTSCYHTNTSIYNSRYLVLVLERPVALSLSLRQSGH